MDDKSKLTEFLDELKSLGEIKDGEDQLPTSEEADNEFAKELAKSVDPHLADMDLSEEQKASVRFALLNIAQDTVDRRLQEIFGDSIFETLDEMLDAGEIEEEQVPLLLDLLYQRVTGQSVLEYTRREMMKVIPILKEQLRYMEDDSKKLTQLPEDQRQLFNRLVSEERFDEAKALLGSKVGDAA